MKIKSFFYAHKNTTHPLHTFDTQVTTLYAVTKGATVALRNATTYTVIDKEVLIAQRDDSTIWQCRFRIDKKWQRTSTGERDFDKAKEKAKELFYKAQARKDADYAPITRKFKDVANVVLKQLHKDFVTGKNKTTYNGQKQTTCNQ